MHTDNAKSIPKLNVDGSNWVIYRDHIMLALEMNGLDIHLTEPSAPKEYVNAGAIGGLEPPTRWKRGEATTKHLIASTIPDSVFNQIKGGTRTKEVWETLKRIYEERTRTTRVNLLKRFRNTQCGENVDVCTHFEELADMREQLAAMGKNIDDEDYTDVLLASLPSCYRTAISAINASTRISKGALTPEIVTELMIAEYEQLTDTKTPQDQALSAVTFKGKKRDVECFNCKKRGHIKADCWAKGGGKEGQGPSRTGKPRGADSANSASTEAWAAMEDWAQEEVCDADEDQQGEVVAVGNACTSEGVESELYDSGASRHMSPFRHRFLSYRTIEPRPITAADKRVFYATGMGDVSIRVPNGESFTTVTLRDVLHAPDMALTIVSISRITKAGYVVAFEGNACRIDNKQGKTIGVVRATENGLYKVDHTETAGAAIEALPLAALHRRLGHIAPDAIRTLVQRGTITGLSITDNTPLSVCDSCEHAKTMRKVIRKEREAPRAEAFGEEIHSDVWGPSPTNSLGGRRYYVTFTDDYTRHTRTHILRTKDETFAAYKSFAAWAKTQHGVSIKRFRSDRGGEFTGHDFDLFLREQGTERRLTTHDTPQHNGIAESLNRRLVERVRAVLHCSGLPKTLWAEAIQFATWLKNRTSTRVIGDTTPYELLHGEKPNLAGLPEWGQRVWVHSASGSKLDARAVEGRWVGYDTDSTHAHRIYWAGKNSVSVERNVKFVPTVASAVRIAFPLLPEGEPTATESASQQADASPSTASDTTKVNPSTPSPSRTPVPTPTRPGLVTRAMARAASKASSSPDATAYANAFNIPGSPIAAKLQGEPNGECPAPNSSDNPPADCVFHAQLDPYIAAAILNAEDDPKTLREARSRSDWPRWKDAMDREMETLAKAETWTTVSRPPHTNVVGSKWVFRIKRKSDGSIDKYKARLVAKGFTQIYGIDYFDTYSPVARIASFRVIFALAARFDWDIESFDFNGAYLNGTLDDDEAIYMQEPPGYESEGNGAFVKRLLKALYGLKQAGRKWYDALRRILIELGFCVSDADPGVFYARVGQHIIIIAIHVDDCAITGSSKKLIESYKHKLNEKYPLTDLGPISWLLGIKVTRNREARMISLSQTSYIESIASRFNLTDAKPAPTPMVPGITYSKMDAPSDPTALARMNSIPYREAVGSLMYASVATRPDITFAVSTLSQFLEHPGEAHWDAVKRVLRYLLGTKTLALTFGSERHDLVGYTDADGATQEHRRAISGSAFLIDGGTVSWGSRKQELVTLSTAESEYVAATHAAKEGIWLRRLIGELLGPIESPTILHCDNQAACKLATTDNFHARTKHIDIRYHFIRQTVDDGTFNIVYCPTDEMVADALTKALPEWKVKGFNAALGLCCA
jgi:transposase InsO family protein